MDKGKAEMKIWFKIWKDARIRRETVIVRDEEDTRTHKVFAALEEAVHEFDLPTPIWLEKNVKSFKMRSSCRFDADSFIEAVDFDHLEMTVLEE